MSTQLLPGFSAELVFDVTSTTRNLPRRKITQEDRLKRLYHLGTSLSNALGDTSNRTATLSGFSEKDARILLSEEFCDRYNYARSGTGMEKDKDGKYTIAVMRRRNPYA